MRILIAGAVLVLVWVCSLTGWMLWETRRAVGSQAYQTADNIASVIEDDIDNAISLYDLSLRGVGDDLHLPHLALLNGIQRNQALFDHAASAPYLGEMMVVNAAGKLTVASQHSVPPNLSFADREFFQVQRDHPDQGLYIGAPFKDPATGVWSVAISRRISNDDGSFAGVVFGTLRLDFFRELFSRVDYGSGGSIALIRRDGILIYRTPADEAPIGRHVVESGAFEHRGAAPLGAFSARSGIDGVPRFYAYHNVGRLPLVLTVGLARNSVLAQWRKKAIWIGIEIAVLTAIIATLGSVLARELRRRGRAEQAARESEQRYRVLAEHSFDMIMRFDLRTLRTTYLSPACRRLYGYEPEAAMAFCADDFVHPDDRPGFRAALARLEDEPEHTPVLYRGRRSDGSYVWVEASLTRCHDSGAGSQEIVSIVRDMTERVRYEAALCQAKEQADSANQSKSLFLATMSHELRTPLNAIIGFAEIMQKEVMGPIGNAQYRSYVGDIHLSGSHLLQLINDILDLTKAEAGMLELNEDEVDVAASIQAVVRVSAASIDKAELAVAVVTPPDLPPIRADERKLRQVLFNLIGNAVKFTPPGGRITVSAQAEPGSGLQIGVTDTGIGIAERDLERVFEPFVQVDSSLARSHQGTGLGLPAVKAIMQLHGGAIQLRSTVGIGTVATITFPPERVIGAAAPPTRAVA